MTVDDQAQVLFSDNSNFANLLVRRKPGEAYEPDCLAPTVKRGWVSDDPGLFQYGVVRVEEPGHAQGCSWKQSPSIS